MSVLVNTLLGDVPRDWLEVTDVVEEGDDARVVATEWRLKRDVIQQVEGSAEKRIPKGEVVRRDVHVAILRGLATTAAQGGAN